MSYWQYVPGPEVNRAVYDLVIASATESDIIVETQCGFGRGIHYLIEGLKARNVRPKVYAFDTFGEKHSWSEHWEGLPSHTPWGEPFDQWAARVGGPSRIMDQFAFHLANSPARDYLKDWAQFPHWTVAEEFKDGIVSHVILNGPIKSTKTFEYVAAKWHPKLKEGGRVFVASLDTYGTSS